MNVANPNWRCRVALPLTIAALALNLLRAAASCVPAPSGLTGWWPAEGNASDIYGTNSGTLQGGATATAPGVVGTCFTFDGTNGYVQIPDSSDLEPTNLTIEAWVRFDGLDSVGSGGAPAGEQYMVFKQNVRTNFFEGYFLGKVRLIGRDALAFGVSSALGQAVEVDSTFGVTTNVWYHVAGVRGPDFIQLYVNGQLNAQTNVSFPQSYGTNALYFGSSGQPYWDRKLRGSLDEVSLYNRVLESNEIFAIYAAGSQGKCKQPTIVSIELTPGNQQGSLGYPLLTIGGLPGQAYGLQTCSSVGATNGWIGLTNATLSGPTDLWLSPNAATNVQRVFRAVPGTVSIP